MISIFLLYSTVIHRLIFVRIIFVHVYLIFYSKLFFFDESVLKNYVIGQTATNNKPSVCVTSCPSAVISTHEQIQNISKITGINYCLYDYVIAGNSSDVSNCPDLPISQQ